MIVLSPERLPDAAESKLREWLRKSEADTFRKVLVARCQLKQAEALAEIAKAWNGSTDYELAASVTLREARDATICLDLFNSFATQPKDQPFTTAKLTPYGHTSPRPETEETN